MGTVRPVALNGMGPGLNGSVPGWKWPCDGRIPGATALWWSEYLIRLLVFTAIHRDLVCRRRLNPRERDRFFFIPRAISQ